MIVLLYLLFFLSGAAALVYQVVWVRSLSLVFGGSHLAVTVVLTVFMGGLALGSWLFGRRADRSSAPLRLYGLLELGIGLSALGFALLLRQYPAIYGPLARWVETDALWLTVLRVAFSAVAMILPTTLMGGTLPVLARLVARHPRQLGRHLAFLYGFNTLGAVAGTLAAAFVLLGALGVSGTLRVAVAVNFVVGLAALVLPRAAFAGGAGEPRAAGATARPPAPTGAGTPVPAATARVVLWGVGISGFCALGYEVLWTRVLSMVVGTSVYSFAIMLVAFLAGIAAGSQAQALLTRIVPGWEARRRPAVVAFGLSQLAIGVTALGTTWALRAVPLHAVRLQRLLLGEGGEFAARQGASFAVAFAFMAVPAFFMGLAFPLAGLVHSRQRGEVGGAVGQVLAFNTVGAIFGAATSGFVLVQLFGLERALQLLAAINLALGLVVLAGMLDRARRRAGTVAVLVAATAALAVVVVGPEWARMWDRKFFAVYRNNQRLAFGTPEKTRDALENTDVLYYHEGVNETISVIRPRRSAQAFVVDGRAEASTHREDVQCQRTLGHLPMLAHPDPRRVFVLGLGTGMTLGATSIHPEVEQLTLAEIELGVLPAARTFGEYNHDVLDHPRLRIVHDDGRNFLRTTREKFDVITADPIHPWSGGAAYLYTAEYFRSAAERLAPGGVICQWLPIYELTLEDLRSVVATFAASFRHTAIWLTYYDAEILASNDPLMLDEARLQRRFADPRLAADLAAVDMGTPREFLSYFLMGDAGVRAFAEGGRINTDDNLWLELSAPRSQGEARLAGSNVEGLARFRESPLGYTSALEDPSAEAERRRYWERFARAAPAIDRAHALGLWNAWASPELVSLMARLGAKYGDLAPVRFLDDRYRLRLGRIPRPIAAERFAVLGEDGRPATLEITAVALRVGQGRAAVIFVDNERREIYGQHYLDAPETKLDAGLLGIASRIMAELRATYEAAARSGADALPSRSAAAAALRRVVEARTQAGADSDD